jgi:hypothetical protein
VRTMCGAVKASQLSGHDGGMDRWHGRAMRCSGRVSRVNTQPETGKVAELGRVNLRVSRVKLG